MERIIAFISGLIFGIGLIIAQMTNPHKIISFLDIFGRWDPSLALVMGGAILMATPFFKYAQSRKHSISGHVMQMPTNTSINPRLLIGSLLFGAGWGLAGFCPGPAIVASATGQSSALTFTAFMLVGFALYALFDAAHNRIKKHHV